MQALKLILVLCFILAGLYLGIAGWVASVALVRSEVLENTGPVVMYGIQFKNAQEAENFRREKVVAEWFPWIWDQPIPPLFIGCVGFGLLGGAIGRLKKMASGVPAGWDTVLIQWLFSGGLAIVLYFLASYFFEPRAGRLIFFVLIALVGGLFAEETFEWLRTKLTKIVEVVFSKQSPTPGS